MTKTQTQNGEKKFHIAIRLLHWAMAVGIILLIIGGFYSTRLTDMPFREYIPLFHRTVGTTLLVLVFIRIIIRLATHNPKFSKEHPWHMRFSELASQVCLYMFMVMIPLSGFLIANMNDHGVLVYGGQLPEMFAGNALLAALGQATHYLFAYTGGVFVVLHVGAVFYHRVRDHIDLMSRMTVWN